MLVQTSPTVLNLSDLDWSQVKKHLTYHDLKVDQEISRIKKSPWSAKKFGGAEGLAAELTRLKEQRYQSLLFGEEDHWTYAGLGNWLAGKCLEVVENRVVYPEPKALPWENVPKHTPRPYQIKIVEELIKARHGAVEVGTGLGKSYCALLLAKHYGLRTVVMTPSKNIYNQMATLFERHFGRKYVGRFGDGKKEHKKLITVAIAASLTRVKEGSDAWKSFSTAEVFIADESHLCPAQTLARVCFGLCSNAPYRYFFSGTQMRNDGLDLLLHAITGDVVFRMTVKEGVDQGWLAKPVFKMFEIESPSNRTSYDPNVMTRMHLYYNDRVNQVAADIANQMVSLLRRPVLILVKEMKQFSCLLTYLKHDVRFAHGGCSEEAGNIDDIPPAYQKSDPTALVEGFNRGDFPILVGTSCVATGTDFLGVGAIIYLQGGQSEIQVKQCVGRGTRLVDGKTDCYFIDFDVDCDVTRRHALRRRAIYDNIYPGLEEVKL